MIKLLKLCQLISKNALHIRNILYFLGTRVFSIIAFVLVVPFFIRNASEEQYGLAAIGFSLFTIATVLDVAFGYVLVQSLGRRFARGRKLATNTIHGLFSFYLLLSCVVALGCVLALIALQLPLGETIMYGSLAAMLPALCISGVVAAVFQSQNQLKPINLSRFGLELSKALALAISGLVTRDISLIGPLLLLAAYVRAALDARYLANQHGIKLRLRVSGQGNGYWRLARLGMPSFFIVAITALVTIGDKLLIRGTFNTEAVAYYSVAYDINTKAYLLVSAVNTAMFAVVLHRFARKSSTFAPLAVGLTTVSLVAAFYYFPLLVFAPTILGHWVSSDFALNAVPLTRVMVLASLLYLYANVFENALTAMGCARQVLHVYVTAIITYGLCVSYAIWQQLLIGFMYSYLMLCIVLCIGFILQYWLITRPTSTTGVKHACS